MYIDFFLCMTKNCQEPMVYINKTMMVCGGPRSATLKYLHHFFATILVVSSQVQKFLSKFLTKHLHCIEFHYIEFLIGFHQSLFITRLFIKSFGFQQHARTRLDDRPLD